MKKYSFIAIVVLAIALSACTQKELLPMEAMGENAWMYDETLPVPILFGNNSGMQVTTKGTAINNMSDLCNLDYFEMMAVDFGQSTPDVLLDRVHATGIIDPNDNTKYKVQFLDAGGSAVTRYYPQTTAAERRNYSFFSYYIPFESTANPNVSISNGEMNATFALNPDHNEDILWARADATDLSDGTKGFNAQYIRRARDLNVLDVSQPVLNFSHSASLIHIIVRAGSADATDAQRAFAEASFEDASGVLLTVGKLKFCPHWSNASLNLKTGVLTNSGRNNTKFNYTSTAVKPTAGGVEYGTGLFIIPGAREDTDIPSIDFTITTPEGEKEVHDVLLTPPSGGFVAGQNYNYYINVSSLEQVDIWLSLDSWPNNPGDLGGIDIG